MRPLNIAFSFTPKTILTLFSLFSIFSVFSAFSFSPLPAQSPNVYEARRAKLLEKVEKGTVILANNGGQDYVTATGENQNFYYLTGNRTINAILVIDGRSGKTTVYKPSSRYGRQEAGKEGSESKTLEDFNSEIGGLAGQSSVLWMDLTQTQLLEKARNGLNRLEGIRNVNPLIHAMRAVKDDYEIGVLRQAAKITAGGIVEVMKAAEPGMNEKDFELILDYSFKKGGSNGLGFGIHAASGPNSTEVHYGLNNRITQPGDMMVFDVGAKYEHYTADITRSFPVSGKFSKEQREIYEVVLNAQKAAIEVMKPGRKITEAYEIVPRELNKGLLKLGLLTDTTQAWQKNIWLMHGWGHHIGLLVHDVSAPYNHEKPEILVPGMVYTMEPGLYFPEGFLKPERPRNPRIPEAEWKEFLEKVVPVYQKYINIGVRIEDDVLITPAGNEVISAEVPKEIPEIEAVMKLKSRFN